MKKQITIFVTVILPLGAGYFLSYLFRNVNGPLAPHLTAEFSQSAASLGLLTSVYFLAFAVAQIPIGIALDRYGPRRVQTSLLFIAAVGALLFATAQTIYALLVGRLLIGFGTAGCLVSGIKAAKHWYAGKNLALVNGVLIMFGGFGALAASSPMVLLVDSAGWRYTIELLAGMSVLLAVMTFLLIPEISHTVPSAKNRPIFPANKELNIFWRFAPMSALSFGGVAALQGLWVVPWLTEVNHETTVNIGWILTGMAFGLIVGGPLLGIIARHAHKHFQLATLLMWIATVLVLLEIMIAFRFPLPDLLLWSTMAALGALPAVSYSVLAEEFPNHVIARVNSLLNVGHTLTAFLLQWLFGVVVAMWQQVDGIYPVQAYQAALLVICVLQVAAITWYILTSRSKYK